MIAGGSHWYFSSLSLIEKQKEQPGSQWSYVVDTGSHIEGTPSNIWID